MPDRTSERGMKSLFAQKQCSALDVEAQPKFCLRVGPLRQSLRQTYSRHGSAPRSKDSLIMSTLSQNCVTH
jgi:hypothetical protein